MTTPGKSKTSFSVSPPMESGLERSIVTTRFLPRTVFYSCNATLVVRLSEARNFVMQISTKMEGTKEVLRIKRSRISG